jgi:hypothetical protein
MGLFDDRHAVASKMLNRVVAIVGVDPEGELSVVCLIRGGGLSFDGILAGSDPKLRRSKA